MTCKASSVERHDDKRGTIGKNEGPFAPFHLPASSWPRHQVSLSAPHRVFFLLSLFLSFSLFLALFFLLSLRQPSLVKRAKINGFTWTQLTIDLPITLVNVGTYANSSEKDLIPCIDTCYSGNVSVGDCGYRTERNSRWKG